MKNWRDCSWIAEVHQIFIFDEIYAYLAFVCPRQIIHGRRRFGFGTFHIDLILWIRYPWICFWTAADRIHFTIFQFIVSPVVVFVMFGVLLSLTTFQSIKSGIIIADLSKKNKMRMVSFGSLSRCYAYSYQHLLATHRTSVLLDSSGVLPMAVNPFDVYGCFGWTALLMQFTSYFADDRFSIRFAHLLANRDDFSHFLSFAGTDMWFCAWYYHFLLRILITNMAFCSPSSNCVSHTFTHKNAMTRFPAVKLIRMYGSSLDVCLFISPIVVYNVPQSKCSNFSMASMYIGSGKVSDKLRWG